MMCLECFCKEELSFSLLLSLLSIHLYQLSIELAKKSIWVFLLNVLEKPMRAFGQPNILFSG